MNKQTLWIVILSGTALLLALANFLPPMTPTAEAASAIREERGYSMVTARTAAGGDVIYVISPAGRIAAFQFNNANRRIELLAGKRLEEVFVANRP